MKQFNNIYCIFEQSGTFKKAFKKLNMGKNVFDIDIVKTNNVDLQIDLFKELLYINERKTIFDTITHNDLIIAFFPCTYFEIQNDLLFNGTHYGIRNKSDYQKIEIIQARETQRHFYYNYFCTLYKYALDKKIPTIIENPYSTQSYLYKYFPIKPTIIDYDRTKLNDNMKKPTMYYFINIEPKANFELINANNQQISCITHLTPNKIDRSLITNDYATNFIKIFIKE